MFSITRQSPPRRPVLHLLLVEDLNRRGHEARYRNAIRAIAQPGRDAVMYIGWDRDGRQLLEVGVLDPHSAEPCITR